MLTTSLSPNMSNMNPRRFSRHRPVGYVSAYAQRKAEAQEHEEMLLDAAGVIWWRAVLLLAIIFALLILSAVSLVSCRTQQHTQQNTDTLALTHVEAAHTSQSSYRLQVLSNYDMLSRCLVDCLIGNNSCPRPAVKRANRGEVPQEHGAPFYYLDLTADLLNLDTQLADTLRHSSAHREMREPTPAPHPFPWRWCLVAAALLVCAFGYHYYGGRACT